SIKKHIRPWGISKFLKWHIRARKLLWMLEKFRANYKPQNIEGKRILAVCSYNWKTIEHPSLTNPVLGDPYVTPIVECLKGNTITYVDATQREYRGFSALKQKARTNQRHVLLEQYATFSTALRVKNALRKFRNAEKILEGSPEFRKSWMYEGIDLWPLFAAHFRCYFDNRLEGHLIDVECAKLLLLREHPDLVIYPCEGGDLAYVFFKLCSDLKIPCIGIQHGTMSYSPLTVHAREEICRGKPECLPRPTKLLVYGSYYRDFLVKNGHYPAEEISVIGNLRYDHFVNAKKLSKKAMAEKYGLDVSKPIVLYVGNILPSQSEYEEMTRAVFQAAKELDVFLVVKQHPGETSDALYHRLASETGLKPFITKNASTLELLTACDVVIGYESTLDYEAMILGKPVIVVNLGNRPDSLPFVREGAALGVYKEEDAVPALKNALFDKKTREDLEKGMRKLVEAHCNKVDGRSAERAAEIIRGLLK
ncbi:MAG: UDP-N-acetylglucosamine 2-epimerase, partial [Candidatus Woesearchaeota archaeon]